MVLLFLLEIFALIIVFLLFVLKSRIILRGLSLIVFLSLIIMIEQEVMAAFMIILDFGFLIVLFLYCLDQMTHALHGFTLKTVLDFLPEAVCFSLADGTPIFVNQAMHALSQDLTKQNHFSLEAIEALFMNDSMITIHGRSYELSQKVLDAYPIKETIIYDRTQERRISGEIQKQNEALQKANASLRLFHESIDDYVRSQEILAAQVHIHEDLGDCLLATQGYLTYHTTDEAELKKMWQTTMLLMHQKEKPYTLWTQLLSAASFAHVDLIKQGVFPKAYEADCIDLVHLYLNVAIRNKNTKVRVVVDDSHMKITCSQADLYIDEKKHMEEIVQKINGEMTIKEGQPFVLEVKWRDPNENI